MTIYSRVYIDPGGTFGASAPPQIYVDIFIYTKSSVFIHWSTSLTLTLPCFLPPTGWFAVAKIILTCWNCYNLSYEYNRSTLHARHSPKWSPPPTLFNLCLRPWYFYPCFHVKSVYVFLHQCSVFDKQYYVTCRARTWFGTCNWWHSRWSFFHWWSAQTWTLQQQHSAP